MTKKIVLIWIIAVAGIGFLFQNCGQNDVSFDQSAGSENPFGFGYVRFLEVDPNLAKNRPPIHLTTIMDNSYSTKQIHSDMVSGFTNAIDQVKGFNVEASLYTTTHDDSVGKSSTQSEKFFVYEDENGKDVKIPFDQKDRIPAQTNFVEKETFRISNSWFLNRQNLKYDFDKDNFQDFKDEYSLGVSSLGTDGADREQGLCTMLKKAHESNLYDDPNNLKYHLYVLATNEDDFTTFNNCQIESQIETQFEKKTTSEACSPGSPDCLFKATINQNDKVLRTKKVNYTYDNEKEVVTFKGLRYRESITGSKLIGDNGVSFDKRVSTISYNVDKYCYKDSVKEPCQSPKVKTVTFDGSCSASQTPKTCSSSELAKAAKLFNVNSAEVYSCKASCQSDWKSISLSKNKVPEQNILCSGNPEASRNCSSADMSAVLSFTGLSSNEIRSCSRNCDTKSESKSATQWNQVTSCSRTSCNSSDIEQIAGLLGVSKSEVTSCNYSCKAQTINPTFTWNSSKSCNELPASCGSNEKNKILSQYKVEPSNIQSCSMNCEKSEASGNYSVELTQGQSCTESSTCGSELSTAQAKAGKPIKSCSISCDTKNSSQPNCSIANLTDTNFCSQTASIKSQCSAQGRDDLDLSSCRLTSGKRTISSVKKTVSGKQTLSIKDLENGATEAELPELVSNQLKKIHGPNGFFASFFIHPSDDPSCRAPSHLSAGERYEELVSILGPKNSSAFPVCLEDYSPALDSVVQVAINSVLTTFNLDLKEGESLIEVKATFLDDSVDVIPKDQYETFKNSITFKDKALLKDIKSFEFKVWGP